MGYLKIICLDECYTYFWVYIYLILFTSCLVSFLSTAFSRASNQTGLPLTRVKTKWSPPLLWWHKMKCLFPQREGAKVPVLTEVLDHTKWGAKTISVGSCVNFGRVKAVQVQCGQLGSIRLVVWRTTGGDFKTEGFLLWYGFGQGWLIQSSSSVTASGTK